MTGEARAYPFDSNALRRAGTIGLGIRARQPPLTLCIVGDNRSTQASESVLEEGVTDSLDGGQDRRLRSGAQRLRTPPPIRHLDGQSLGHFQPGDGRMAEMGIDALDHDGLEMLELQCEGTGNSHMQHAAASIARTRQTIRKGMARQCFADDHRPIEQQARLGEAALGHRPLGRFGQRRTDSPHSAPADDLFLCHGIYISRAMDPTVIQEALLAWYDRHRRDLPWRAKPGETADPYRVWLSEIMLQQTTVKTVPPYFDEFLRRWPTIQDLAAADLDDVLRTWAGLGYYARARNLHACARAVAARPGGTFPSEEAGLLELPGVGPYTAAAIASIAFDRPAMPVDGNVERVVSRFFAITEPLPGSKRRLTELARGLAPQKRAGDFAQAMMDLGSTVCTPTKPRCILCPLAQPCRARAKGIAEDLPAKAPKKERPTRYGIIFFATRSDGTVLLRKRPEKGLLGGMTELPTTEWRDSPYASGDVTKLAPAPASWRTLPGLVRHTFTHFHLELIVAAARIASVRGIEGSWIPIERLGGEALPSVMRKVVAHALKAAN